jgi:hypothetical protein
VLLHNNSAITGKVSTYSDEETKPTTIYDYDTKSFSFPLQYTNTSKHHCDRERRNTEFITVCLPVSYFVGKHPVVRII